VRTVVGAAVHGDAAKSDMGLPDVRVKGEGSTSFLKKRSKKL
jgi:hypothetical protein